MGSWTDFLHGSWSLVFLENSRPQSGTQLRVLPSSTVWHYKGIPRVLEVFRMQENHCNMGAQTDKGTRSGRLIGGPLCSLLQALALTGDRGQRLGDFVRYYTVSSWQCCEDQCSGNCQCFLLQRWLMGKTRWRNVWILREPKNLDWQCEFRSVGEKGVSSVALEFGTSGLSTPSLRVTL